MNAFVQLKNLSGMESNVLTVQIILSLTQKNVNAINVHKDLLILLEMEGNTDMRLNVELWY